MSAGILSLGALVSAIACILSDYAGRRRRVYFFKPVTMIFIIGLVLVLAPVVSPQYRLWIVAGLAFSLAGDILLMLPRDRFLPGLAAFLLAHWCYIAAFAPVLPHAQPVLLVPGLLAGAALFAAIRPVGAVMKIAVIGYIVSIVLMGWLALENWRAFGTAALSDRTLAAVGASLFILSDTLIGVRRFRGDWRAAQALILGTYFPAQWLLALSVAAGTARL